MCQISRKIHGRSLRNSRKIHGPHSEYIANYLVLKRDVANSKICTKAVNKTLKTFINESKSVKIHEKSRISRKWAFFTEEGQFHVKCHCREIVN